MGRRFIRWEATLLGVVSGLAVLSAAVLVRQASAPDPVRFWGIAPDRLGAVLSLLVASVGAATFRFSMRYLDGDPGRGAFLVRLAFTIAAAYVLMLADNLLLLFAAWSLTGLGLHALLTHYPDRPRPSARPGRSSSSAAWGTSP